MKLSQLYGRSVDAVAAVLCHTDVDDYAAVCRSAALALRPGGRFAHVGIHPCFVGAFVDGSKSTSADHHARLLDARANGGELDLVRYPIARRSGAPSAERTHHALTSAGLVIDRVEGG